MGCDDFFFFFFFPRFVFFHGLSPAISSHMMPSFCAVLIRPMHAFTMVVRIRKPIAPASYSRRHMHP